MHRGSEERRRSSGEHVISRGTLDSKVSSDISCDSVATLNHTSSGRQAALLREPQKRCTERLNASLGACSKRLRCIRQPASQQQQVQLSRSEYNFMPIYELHSRWASSFTLNGDTFLVVCKYARAGCWSSSSSAFIPRQSRRQLSCLSRCRAAPAWLTRN